MWATLALSAAVSLAPAQANGLELKNVRFTQGVLGSARADSKFLAGELSFLDIPRVCRAVLSHHPFSARPTLEELGTVDRWARNEVSRWLCARLPNAPTT